jgi:hypothetical protein
MARQTFLVRDSYDMIFGLRLFQRDVDRTIHCTVTLNDVDMTIQCTATLNDVIGIGIMCNITEKKTM